MLCEVWNIPKKKNFENFSTYSVWSAYDSIISRSHPGRVHSMLYCNRLNNTY